MERIETELLDCYILEPNRFGDNRGYFESITEEELKSLGFNKIFQVSNSLSGKGILRGLHFQNNPYCQAKVVRCHRGKVLDVVVDIRKDSKTYGKWISVELTPDNGRLLYVPRGFAHGFLSLSDDTLFEYYVDNLYNPKMEDGIAWDDKDININWKEIFKKYDITEPVLSDKDKNRCSLKECKSEFYRTPKKYIVTGYKGQLGYDIIRELHNRGEYDILALDIDRLDITDRDATIKMIKDYKPDVIFHCAAWTAVDKAEDMEDMVCKVNVEGTRNITDASIEVGAKLFYISTDYVFDGEKDGLYNEMDKPNPKSVYGKTKYEGELEASRNPNHFITRISWVFGINGNNFIKTMLKLSKTKDELNVVNDQIGSPTYTVDLAKLLVEMSYTDKYGTYHVNNDGFCSWAEFASYIMKINNKNTKINPVSTEKYLEITGTKQAYRPRNSKLSKDKLIENGFTMLPTWEDATKRYCEELERENLL
jgi:dTDP-4-dehydrorhamnose reductase/dTDP-4-dehydrorhamnose 3,5-epimerase